MSPRMAIALLVGGSLALANCGGESGPTKDTYIADADRICASTRTMAAPLVGRLASATAAPTADHARQLAPDAERLYTVGRRYVAQLRSLEQPSGDRDAINRFLDPTASAIDKIGAVGEALGRGESVRALALLQQIQSDAQRANDAARAYGFRECGSVLTAG